MSGGGRSPALAGVFAVAVALAATAAVACSEHSLVHPTVRGFPATAGGQRPCSRVAAPGGRDRNPGTLTRPFRSLQRLANALRAGQTGCLRAGTYVENPDLFRGGSPGRRVTIESYPGERARLDGALWITSGASYVTLRNLTICGAPGPPSCDGNAFVSGEASAVQVSADHASFDHLDVSNARGICFILGTAQAGNGRDGPADHATIEHSTIHNCGVPGHGNLVEGVYVAYSSAALIEHNTINANASMGVQLYPDAQYTAVEYNVMWGNGEGVLFGGSDDQVSSHNVVAHNLIGHSVARWNIESYWPGPVGERNLATQNCVYADNRLNDGYYNQGGGIEPAALGADGFVSSDERRWPACTLSGLGRLRPPR